MPLSNNDLCVTSIFFGKFFLIKSLIILIAYFPVAAGSPGPFDKNIPFGLRAKIFSADVLQETTVTYK